MDWDAAITFNELFKLSFGIYWLSWSVYFISGKEWARWISIVPLAMMFQILLSLWIKTW